MTLLHPKEITVTTLKGEERAYIISRFPATAGLEIMREYAQFDTWIRGSDHEDLLLRIMSHVAVKGEGRNEPLLLSTKALVDTHVPDCVTLARIEDEIISYNSAYSWSGNASDSVRVSFHIGNMVIHGGGEDDMEREQDGDQPEKRILQ